MIFPIDPGELSAGDGDSGEGDVTEREAEFGRPVDTVKPLGGSSSGIGSRGGAGAGAGAGCSTVGGGGRGRGRLTKGRPPRKWMVDALAGSGDDVLVMVELRSVDERRINWKGEWYSWIMRIADEGLAGASDMGLVGGRAGRFLFVVIVLGSGGSGGISMS